MERVLLTVEALHAGYGASEVLHGVSLTVAEREIVCLLGSNGAGKTTTIRAIAGQVRPSGGRVSLDSRDTTVLAPSDIVGLGLATVPEGRCIFPSLTVRENLRMGAYSRRRAFREQGELDEVFAMFPRLKERQGQAGGTLSGGEQQMLAIGRALMARPRVLLLDEPSMGLAPILVEQVFQTIANLSQAGITILLVEQNAEAALAIASRGYVLERGRIVLQGAAAELHDNEHVRSAYLGVGAD